MSLRHLAANISIRLASAGSFELTEALFLRLLGVVYLAAFGSFWPQIVGLIGTRGIVPAGQFLAEARAGLGAKAFLEIPTLLWLRLTDSTLMACCIIGCVAAIFLIGGYFTRIAAAVCWVLYLSVVVVGQPFTNFQWDALLLESGFLALFAGTRILVWAYRFLLFRLMFESGMVKLLSHDANWRNLHALRYHFMTQPLPNPIAYYAYRLPAWMLDSMTAATLMIELVAPFLLFGPRRVRHIGAAFLMFLQVLIIVTGNYAFFNMLTLALCLWAFDDSTFIPLTRFLRRGVLRVPRASLQSILSAVVIALMLLGAVELFDMVLPVFGRQFSRLTGLVSPFEIVNTYGLFAVMTTTRAEVIIEGSDDQVTWKEYSFPYKPGELHRGLPFVAPYQPRLDWQMWFAGLGNYQENTWVGGLMYRLLTGNSPALNLIDTSPFSNPPRYVRALLYEYRFTTPAERRDTGAVWQRTLLGPWFGPVSLRAQ
ncbi:MAG: lipase maturation factor family protein [Acidobacteriaceae bacterium]|nr:lipase maturation factor family protein [Acidobacteriaceae bacterium]